MNQGEAGAGRDSARRRTRSRRAKARDGVPFVLIAIALVLLALRVVVVNLLASSPLLIQPVLADASYQAQIVEMADPAGGVPELPRGSILYARVASWIPGAGEGNPTVLRYVHCLFDALAGFLLALWVYRREGRIAGIATLALYALDPLGGFFASRVIPVSFVTAILATVLLVLDSARSQATPILHHLILGLLLALGFLIEPLLFTILTVLVVWQTVREASPSRTDSAPASGASRTPRPGIGNTIFRVAPLTAPLVLAALLLLMRNDNLRDGGWALSWGSGYSAYQAVHPETGGTPRSLEIPSWKTEGSIRSDVWEALGREGTSYDVYRFYATRAFQQVIEHPVETLGVLLVKAGATLGAWPVPDSLSPTFLLGERVQFARYGAFFFAILLALGTAGWYWRRISRTAFGEAPPAPGGIGEMAIPGAREARAGATAGVTGSAKGALSVLEIGLLAVALTCLLGVTSAAARQPALPILAALGGIWIGAVLDSSRRRLALSPRTLAAALGAFLVSIGAGFLSPTSALRNPSEDLRLVASNFVQSGSWRQAIPLLESSLAADSLNLESRVLLARAYQNDGLLDAAQEQLERAHAVDSLHVGALAQLSALAMVQGDAPRAVALMNAAVLQHPNNPLYLNELGQLLLRTGNIPNAQALFTRALQVKPDYRVASDNLQVVETLLRRAEQQIYPPEMRLAPDDPISLHVPMIVQAMEAGEWTRADSLIAIAESERGDLVLPHWLRAAYYSRRGEPGAAIAALERCQQLAPCRPAIVELLVNLLTQQGERARAQSLVESCLATTTDDPDRQAGLQQIMQQIQAPSPSAPGE